MYLIARLCQWRIGSQGHRAQINLHMISHLVFSIYIGWHLVDLFSWCLQGNPMAFLVENGGGRAITGAGAVLDLQPSSIHERSPIFLGSKQDIDRIEALHRTSAA